MKHSCLVYSFGFLASVGATACSVAQDGRNTTGAFGTVSQAETVAPATYLYLRCNSTSWGVDAKSRLVPTGNPNVFQISLDIREPWMVTDGDDCVLTQTPEKDGWGAWQKYYSTHFYPSTVPSAGRFYSQDNASGFNFKMKFSQLGRFQALVNWQERFISVTKEGESARGNVVWASAGDPMVGEDGSMYRSNHVYELNKTFVSRVDVSLARDLWVREFQNGGTLYSECAWKDLVVTFADGMLRGIDPSTGADRWTNDFSGRINNLSSMSPSVICRGDSERIYFTYSNWETSQYGFGAVSRNSGRLLWQQETTSYPLVAAVTANHIVVQGEENSQRTYQAYSVSNGALAWARTESGYAEWYVDGAGNLFMEGGEYPERAFSRIVPTTGVALWTVSIGDRSGKLDQYGPLVSGRNAFSRLDPETGRTLWEITASNPSANTYLWSNVLRAKKIAVMTTSGDPTTATVALADGNTGQQIWTRVLPSGKTGNVLQDKAGQVYLAVGDELWALDQSTGLTKWTFRPAERLDDSFPYGRGVRAIVDSDDNNIYVSYSEYGYRCNPMGVAALDPTSGAVRWDHFAGAPLWFAAVDAKYLYATTACMAPGVLQAIIK